MNDYKRLIISAINDLVKNFLCYDRKEDEDLPLGAIETALKKGQITMNEIVDTFYASLSASLQTKPLPISEELFEEILSHIRDAPDAEDASDYTLDAIELAKDLAKEEGEDERK